MASYRRYKTVVMSDLESEPLTNLLNEREGSLIEHIEKHGTGWLVIYSYPDWQDNDSMDNFEGGVL